MCVRGVDIALSGPRQQRALAMLLLHPDQLVSLDRLVDAVWDETPPTSARRQVRDLVTRLRRGLVEAGAPPGIIRTVADGYSIDTAECQFDARQFTDLASAAQRNATADPAAAARLLREALSLWRGGALAGLHTGALRSAAATWDERRLTVWELCLGMELRLGRHLDVLPELSALAAERPYAEEPVILLLTGLLRAGRRGEALAAYQRFRRYLSDELGLEPGPGLQAAHRAILRDVPAPVPGPGRAAGAQMLATPLPTITAGGVARRPLDAALRPAATGASPRLVTLWGMPGVGKTALAVHWANRVRADFPDGQLYADLRGFHGSGRVADPAEVIRDFLDALGVAPRQLPDGPQAQAVLFRSLTAERRLLVVLDNARDADQVRPLLPGGASRTVVTSRDRLTTVITDFDAHPLAVHPPDWAEAADLLRRRTGAGPADRPAVMTVVRAYGRLPLALTLVATRLRQSGFALGEIAAEVHRSDLAGWPAVREVFSWSYRILQPPAARLFRLLGLVPGADIAPGPVAALAGWPEPLARATLRELADVSLLEEHRSGRFRMHDLLRIYARDLSEQADVASLGRVPASRTA